MYDAVLAGALALNGSLEEMKDDIMFWNDMSYDYDTFMNATGNTTEDVQFTVSSLDLDPFQGVSGRVKFMNRSRYGILALYQYILRNDTIVKDLIALYDPAKDKIEFPPGGGPQWAGNEPPADRSSREGMYLRQPQYAPVVYAFTAIVALAVLLNVALFIFNLVTAHTR